MYKIWIGLENWISFIRVAAISHHAEYKFSLFILRHTN